MKMCWFGIFILILLSGFCQPCGAEIDLRSKIAFELLSLRIDNVIHETQNYKSELSETKAVVEKIEEKLETIDTNMLLMASKAEISVREMLQSLVTENAKVIQDASKHFIQEKLRTELKLLRKMLTKEKLHLRKRVLTLENKFTKMRSEVVNKLTLMNDSIESKVDNLNNSMTMHKIVTDNRLTLAEREVQNDVNKIDMPIQGTTADFENKIKNLQSEVVKQLTLMNDSIESKVDNFEQSMTMHKIVIDNRFTLAESGIQNFFNKTEIIVQEITAKIENILTNSVAKIGQIEMVFTGNINIMSQCLSTVNSNITSAIDGLKGRLDNAENQLRTMSSKLGKAEIHIPENGYLLGNERSVVLNGETYRICCKNGFEVLNDDVFPYDIETCQTIQNDYGTLELKVQCFEKRCDPSDLLNGYAEYENNSRIWSKYPSGLFVFLFCHDGFKFYDYSGLEIQTIPKRQCTKGEIINAPTCIEAKCSLADLPSNPFSRYRNPDTMAPISTDDYIDSGKRIEVICDNLYELYINNSKEYIETPFIARCRKGKFNNDKFPVCVEKRCTFNASEACFFEDDSGKCKKDDFTIQSGNFVNIKCDRGYIRTRII